ANGAPGLKECTEYIATSNNGIMRGFDRVNNIYKVNRISDGKQIGTNGATLLKRCGEYIATSTSDLVCIFEDTARFHAFNIHTGQIMGKDNNHASTLERCAEYVKTQKNGLFCHYAGGETGN